MPEQIAKSADIVLLGPSHKNRYKAFEFIAEGNWGLAAELASKCVDVRPTDVPMLLAKQLFTDKGKRSQFKSPLDPV